MVLISRRHFVLGGVGALGAVLGDAFLLEPTAIDVSQHVIPVPGLPPGLEGVRIACVSDVHLGGGVSPAARAALAVLARERPDLVLLSGDICNERVDLPTLTVWAREARGTAAAFATLGAWQALVPSTGAARRVLLASLLYLPALLALLAFDKA